MKHIKICLIIIALLSVFPAATIAMAAIGQIEDQMQD